MVLRFESLCESTGSAVKIFYECKYSLFNI